MILQIHHVHDREVTDLLRQIIRNQEIHMTQVQTALNDIKNHVDTLQTSFTGLVNRTNQLYALVQQGFDRALNADEQALAQSIKEEVDQLASTADQTTANDTPPNS